MEEIVKKYEKDLKELISEGFVPPDSVNDSNAILKELKIKFPEQFKQKSEIKINHKCLDYTKREWERSIKDYLVILSDIKEGKLKETKTKEGDEKDKKIEELIDTLQRLQAEFENYKKYVEKSKAEFVKYAHADIIEKLLPVLDSFELALKNTTDKEKLIKGIELIYTQFYSILEKEGLKKIEANGKFNPNLHEVLLKEKSDKEEDTILEELQKGYMLNERVIRHSKVKVSKKK